MSDYLRNLTKQIHSKVRMLKTAIETSTTKRLLRLTEMRILKCIISNRTRKEDARNIFKMSQDGLQNQETSMERSCK